MVETILALVFLTVVFFTAFSLSQMLQARTVLDHAAARAARARAVGFNEFMCLKSARAAMIPVAGARLWPAADAVDEAARVPIYLASEHPGRAAAILDYAYWHTTEFGMSDGATVETRLKMATDDWTMDGAAAVESHYPLYMVNGGL